ncbi:PIG-L deacetylase family protein [Sinomicrobium oceani]|uniref:PIG-L deacetylase family protein n=1 Tax=Sinomicrobium oceani TaxID=1150368 RepID=UPI00227B2276|nr:PIG-L family deacetylase [Sinomicrobium oceani]
MIHIISPHIDDALLSIGGLIFNWVQDKKKVTVHYVFTVSNWTNPVALVPTFKSLRDTLSVTDIRKSEEKEVAKILGHAYAFMDFEDLPLRKSNSKQDDNKLIINLALDLSKRIPKNEICLFPLGQKHPDHILIGQLGSWLVGMGYKIYFYEDLPYVARNVHDYQSTFKKMKVLGYKPKLIPIDINKKTSLLKFYKSQMSDEWLDCVKSYGYNLIDNKFYERIWVEV